MVNPDTIIVDHCKRSGTSLYTLVGTRIYMPELPTGFNNSNASVVILRRGGFGLKYSNAIVMPSYQIRCYGGSTKISDAENVAWAFFERFNAKKMQDGSHGRLLSATCTVPQNAQIEPDSGYPVCYLTMETMTST